MKKIMTIVGAILIASAVLLSCGSNSIPDDWKGKKLYDVVDGRNWIIINNDNTFNLHHYLPYSNETFEWKGKIENMKLITQKKLSYKGRYFYKSAEIDPKIEFMDIGGEFLRINFKGYSTLSNSYETNGSNYTPQNVTPY